MSVHIGVRSLVFVKQENDEIVQVDIFHYSNIESFKYDPQNEIIFIKRLGEGEFFNFSFNTTHYNLLLRRIKEF